MDVYHKKSDLKANLTDVYTTNKTVGFVPTMGALHQGHLALIRAGISENDVVIVSIFVNPTQFNNPEDLDTYPRTLRTDIELLESVSSDIILFAPSVSEIYGDTITSISYDFDGLEHEMEGKFRDGHFNGVGTVLHHFFKLIMPTKAYFGEKDYQQLQIVKKLVALEEFPIDIIGCPIYREESGLALSSRNKRLNSHQTQIAPIIYQSLLQVKKDFNTKSISTLKTWIESYFSTINELELEYFEIADAKTLQSITEKDKTMQYRAFIAVFAGEVRLIDNIALN